MLIQLAVCIVILLWWPQLHVWTGALGTPIPRSSDIKSHWPELLWILFQSFFVRFHNIFCIIFMAFSLTILGTQGAWYIPYLPCALYPVSGTTSTLRSSLSSINIGNSYSPACSTKKGLRKGRSIYLLKECYKGLTGENSHKHSNHEYIRRAVGSYILSLYCMYIDT